MVEKTPVEKVEKIVGKVVKKIGRLSPYGKKKKIFGKSKLTVTLPYKRGEKILNQRSGFFKEEYEKEKTLLSWS